MENKSEDTIHIVELFAENIMRLKAVTIRPHGNAVVIGGENRNGKTSALDAVAMALGGEKLVPKEPIRKGQDRGVARVELSNGLIVERNFKRTDNAKGYVSSLKVSSKDRSSYRAPQEMLSALISDFSFDPLKFAEAEPDKQLSMLKHLVGLDFTGLDGQRQSLYDERREVNRKVKDLTSQIEGIKLPKDPGKEISIESLLEQVEELETENRKAEDAQKRAEEGSRTVENLQASLSTGNIQAAQLQAEIEALQARLLTIQNNNIYLSDQIVVKTKEAQELKAEALDFEIRDIKPILAEISSAQTHNTEVNNFTNLRKQRGQLVADHREAEKQASDLTLEIEKIDDEKEKQIREAEFPVEGLGFSETGVLFNDVPLEQASAGEIVDISIAMGMALNPQLKVLLVRNASLLDKKRFDALVIVAEESDYQIFLERVGDGPEVEFIIVDGEVME